MLTCFGGTVDILFDFFDFFFFFVKVEVLSSQRMARSQFDELQSPGPWPSAVIGRFRRKDGPIRVVYWVAPCFFVFSSAVANMGV